MSEPDTRMPYYTAIPLTFIYYCALIVLTFVLLVALGTFIMGDHPVEVWSDIRNIPPAFYWPAIRAALVLAAVNTTKRLWTYYSE